MTKYDVFISYSRRDTEVADRICQALERQNISYFIDRQSIEGGAVVSAILGNAIVGSSLFLFIASENSYNSIYTCKEVTFAFEEKKTVLPYIIDNSKMPVDLRFMLTGLNWRNSKDHPIDSVLMSDICNLLGKRMKETLPAVSEEDSHDNANPLSRVMEWSRKTAEQGYFKAQSQLENCYEYGTDIAKNLTDAVSRIASKS